VLRFAADRRDSEAGVVTPLGARRGRHAADYRSFPRAGRHDVGRTGRHEVGRLDGRIRALPASQPFEETNRAVWLDGDRDARRTRGEPETAPCLPGRPFSRRGRLTALRAIDCEFGNSIPGLAWTAGRCVVVDACARTRLAPANRLTDSARGLQGTVAALAATLRSPKTATKHAPSTPSTAGTTD
jgi:hypothetical protein